MGRASRERSPLRSAIASPAQEVRAELAEGAASLSVLAINAGSSTVKLEIVEARASSAQSDGGTLARGHVEHGRAARGAVHLDVGGRRRSVSADARGVGDAVRGMVAALRSEAGELLAGVAAVGHRVVHGGRLFTGPRVVDDGVLAGIESLEELAPLHNRLALEGIRAAREILPELPHVAVFDTAFFADLPAAAAAYALPRDVSERHGVRRFGFHGLSHAWLSRRHAALSGSGAAGIVTLHLGSGCSAAAIRGGRPLETSMGFTPLEGLVMGTRSGDVDPGAVTFLARREALNAEALDDLLNRRSGLLGLTGSADVRELEARARAGDARADAALEVFAHRARKYVGAYLAVLGGAEALVFSGGIGENSPGLRRRICAGMDWCGFAVDAPRNEAAVGREAPIGTGTSGTGVWVIPTREERCIARETERALTAAPHATDLDDSTEEPR